MNRVNKIIIALLFMSISYATGNVAEIGELREALGSKEDCNTMQKDISKLETKPKKTPQDVQNLLKLHYNHKVNCEEKSKLKK